MSIGSIDAYKQEMSIPFNSIRLSLSRLQASYDMAIKITNMYSSLSTEADLTLATEACIELLWMNKFVKEIHFKQDHYVVFLW